MNLNMLEKKLMDAARATVPADHVPYASEKRIMARLEGAAPADLAALWGQALWRAAMPCVLVALLLGAWSLWEGAGKARNGDFSKEFETAVLVASDQPSDSW